MRMEGKRRVGFQVTVGKNELDSMQGVDHEHEFEEFNMYDIAFTLGERRHLAESPLTS